LVVQLNIHKRIIDVSKVLLIFLVLGGLLIHLFVLLLGLDLFRGFRLLTLDCRLPGSLFLLLLGFLGRFRFLGRLLLLWLRLLRFLSLFGLLWCFGLLYLLFLGFGRFLLFGFFLVFLLFFFGLFFF